jgi:hypothetical protein
MAFFMANKRKAVLSGKLLHLGDDDRIFAGPCQGRPETVFYSAG